MSSEERAVNKITRILARLDPEAAARVAQSMGEKFVVEAAHDAASAPAEVASGPGQDSKKDDARPSFLQTEFRMAVGKDLLDRQKSGDKG
ncbi:MAG TPA: hypothetical protein VGD06_04270 [Acidobacteriota bacterium]